MFTSHHRLLPPRLRRIKCIRSKPLRSARKPHSLRLANNVSWQPPQNRVVNTDESIENDDKFDTSSCVHSCLILPIIIEMIIATIIRQTPTIAATKRKSLSIMLLQHCEYLDRYSVCRYLEHTHYSHRLLIRSL